MKLTFAATAFLAGVIVIAAIAGPAGAQSLVDGSVEAGKARSTTCAACHGADGNSVNPEWPSLAGQHAKYTVDQLQAFKDGTRSNPLMTGQAMMLSEQDMRDLAVYYEAQRPAARTVSDASLVDEGRALYRAGDEEAGAAACIACHGPTGKGNPAAAYPMLRGQYAVYTAKQLRDYADGTRKSDGSRRIMRDIAMRLTEEEIAAVSAYVQGLRGSVPSAAD